MTSTAIISAAAADGVTVALRACTQDHGRAGMTWLRYVLHNEVPAFEAKGWVVVSGLYGNHGHYSVLMEYRGEGEPT
jgi:hypothetical protein